MATRTALRQKAGFLASGKPVILDANMSTTMAQALRSQGFNVRAVQEIYGSGRIRDSDIYELAEQLDAKVLTKDRGRQFDGGFFQRSITVDDRVNSPEAVARLLKEALEKEK